MMGPRSSEETLKGSFRVVVYAHDTVSGETRASITFDCTSVKVKRDAEEIELTLYNYKER